MSFEYMDNEECDRCGQYRVLESCDGQLLCSSCAALVGDSAGERDSDDEGDD